MLHISRTSRIRILAFFAVLWHYERCAIQYDKPHLARSDIVKHHVKQLLPRLPSLWLYEYDLFPIHAQLYAPLLIKAVFDMEESSLILFLVKRVAAFGSN